MGKDAVCRVQAGASTGVVGKVVWQATASMSLRASAKLGTMGVEVEVGGSHRVSEFSTAGCSVVAGLQVLFSVHAAFMCSNRHHAHR